jgi:cell division protein FtsB
LKAAALAGARWRDRSSRGARKEGVCVSPKVEACGEARAQRLLLEALGNPEVARRLAELVAEAVTAERGLALKLASAVAGVIAAPLDATKHDVEDLKRELADLRARVQNIETRIQDIERRLGEVRKTARDA